MTDPHRLRISDQEREQIVAALGQAAADGRLTLDEYAERCTRAYEAVTRGDLAAVVDDLPVALTGPTTTPVQPVPALVPVASTEQIVAVLGNDSRTGRWVVPPVVDARAIFGECLIELHEAVINQPHTVVEAVAFCGRVTVVVPEGIDVRVNGYAVLGARTHEIRQEPVPGAPIVEIRARAILGEVAVRSPRRRKGWRKRV